MGLAGTAFTVVLAVLLVVPANRFVTPVLSLLIAIAWMFYGLVRRDYFLAAPSGWTVFFGFVQLVRVTPWKVQNKHTQNPGDSGQSSINRWHEVCISSCTHYSDHSNAGGCMTGTSTSVGNCAGDEVGNFAEQDVITKSAVMDAAGRSGGSYRFNEGDGVSVKDNKIVDEASIGDDTKVGSNEDLNNAWGLMTWNSLAIENIAEQDVVTKGLTDGGNLNRKTYKGKDVQVYDDVKESLIGDGSRDGSYDELIYGTGPTGEILAQFDNVKEALIGDGSRDGSYDELMYGTGEILAQFHELQNIAAMAQLEEYMTLLLSRKDAELKAELAKEGDF